MNRVRVLTVLATVAGVLAGSQWGFATPSITLTSSGGGIYDYGVTVPPFETVTLNPNATITLLGLSGVTGASTADFLGTCFAISSFTPSSALYGQKLVFGSCELDNSSDAPFTEGTLVVDSSVLTLGTVDFSMQTSAGTISGTTQGPVAAAAVPEPAGLV